MHSYAEYSDSIAPDSYIPLLKEMMAWDALCPVSCVLVRKETETLGIDRQPSPLHWSRQKEWPWAIKESSLRPWHTCLDIGGSWSVFKYALARRTRSVTCLDLDKEAIDKSVLSQKTLGVWRINHVQGDCRRLPFADSSFDRVFSLSVYEHMEKGYIQAVDESLRVLKPGGIFMLTMDIAIEGIGKDNFYVGYPEVGQIIKHLKLPRMPGKKVVGAVVREGVTLAVVLLRFVKGVYDG